MDRGHRARKGAGGAGARLAHACRPRPHSGRGWRWRCPHAQGQQRGTDRHRRRRRCREGTPPMTDHLAIIVDGRIMGDIRKDKRARLTLAYDADWRQTPDAYPLSLSMPLIVAQHEHAKIEPWLWGLLPDNEFILARWGQRFQISSRNPFAMLSHVGEDCAGAIQIVQPERADKLLSQPAGQVEWLDDKEIAERIRILRKDQSAWRMARDAGQFSLAGARPKTALLFENGRWGVPTGRAPTTHIIKPPNDAYYDGHAENEHICLALARALGLPAALSHVRAFEGEVAIVVARYDRINVAKTIRRLHQEDMCQALGVLPTGKYENLNPASLGTDSTGLGSHQTQIGLDLQYLYEVYNSHYLRTRFIISRLHSSSVSVSGLNSYGGTIVTNGKIKPGSENGLDLAFEYTLTQNWVAVMEGTMSNGQATRFNGILNIGNIGSPEASIGSGNYREKALAPALEYNFNGNLGLIGGVWFPVSGKNTSHFMTYVMALNAYW